MRPDYTRAPAADNAVPSPCRSGVLEERRPSPLPLAGGRTVFHTVSDDNHNDRERRQVLASLLLWADDYPRYSGQPEPPLSAVAQLPVLRGNRDRGAEVSGPQAPRPYLRLQCSTPTATPTVSSKPSSPASRARTHPTRSRTPASRQLEHGTPHHRQRRAARGCPRQSDRAGEVRRRLQRRAPALWQGAALGAPARAHRAH